MKKTIVYLLFVPILFACNNAADDSVEKADSTNQANADSANRRNGVATDERSAEFLVRAANSGMAEVELAKTAQAKATLSEVKNFAAMLEKDHSAANSQVKSFASQRNVTLPDTISGDKREMINDVEKRSGKDFDKEYLDRMIRSHSDGIDLFENTRANATDVDIKNFADKTLPTLKMHLDSAKAIRKRNW
jgi:putative membrane protein